MVSKRVLMRRDAAISFSWKLMLVLLIGVVGIRADTEKDREQCGDKLAGLLSCVPYVGGEAKSPTIDCCSGLKDVLQNSKKCLCILIKDRDDPNLGFHLNASLAVHLPSACHAPANISQCVDLLHLAPNSPEARVFEGFEKTTTTNTTTSSTTPVSPAAGGGGADKRSSSPSVAAHETSGAAVVSISPRLLLFVAAEGILSFVVSTSHFLVLP